MEVSFTNSCAEVAEEIKARASSIADGVAWVDPHNKGTYSLLKSTGSSFIETQRVTANKVFTDKQDFTLTPSSTGGCDVTGCSESQGVSAADNGTNFCDMFDLFCNASDCYDGNCCKVLKNNLTYTVESKNCTPFSFECPGDHESQLKTCIKNAGDAELERLQRDAVLSRIFQK